MNSENGVARHNTHDSIMGPSHWNGGNKMSIEKEWEHNIHKTQLEKQPI